ncbi:MAG TPA: holo-ACP synthase [Candidatus Acidoferrales bacterium]|nr:holo-ACP synthase [Candidatus Acidoferrales bacterium]
MIVGLGIDIAEIHRIETAIRKHGDHFLHRLFTPAEIEYCESYRNRYERYAGRFAAKEAAMKALGTGWRRGVRWKDIEVTREPGGKPALRLAGSAAEIASQLGVRHIAVSITHAADLAQAQVIFEN